MYPGSTGVSWAYPRNILGVSWRYPGGIRVTSTDDIVSIWQRGLWPCRLVGWWIIHCRRRRNLMTTHELLSPHRHKRCIAMGGYYAYPGVYWGISWWVEATSTKRYRINRAARPTALPPPHLMIVLCCGAHGPTLSSSAKPYGHIRAVVAPQSQALHCD